LGRHRELPRTTNSSAGDFLEAHRRLAQSTKERILSIHMRSPGSGAYQAAAVARGIRDQTHLHVWVEVIDSGQTSLCYGWTAIEAARAVHGGKRLDEIVGMVRALIPVAQMIQTADTVRYLYTGGRTGKAQHLVGSLLNIKPLIGMKEEVIVVL